MGLKILHSADWHLDSPFVGFSEVQRAFLKEEQKKIPGKIADLCRRENCDMMLLAGDLFDGEASRETVDLLKKELENAAVPVLISPGNHDFCGVGSPWVEESWPENVYIFRGGLEEVTISSLNCKVYGAGFRSMDCPSLLEGFQAAGDEKYAIGLFHGDPVQKKSPYNPITVAQVKHSALDYLALGHVHKAGTFRAGQTLCAWPGCPMGRGWDETGEKGVCIVTLSDEIQVKAVGLDAPRFQEMDVEIGNDALAALEEALPGGGSSDFFRVNLTGYGQADLEELGRNLKNFPNLELRDKTEVPVDLWEDAGEDTLEGVYFRMLRQGMEDSGENGEVFRMAAEISRKILLGKEVKL